MADDTKGQLGPNAEEPSHESGAAPSAPAGQPAPEAAVEVSHSQTTDDPYAYYGDTPSPASTAVASPQSRGAASSPPPPPASKNADEDDDGDDGMLRMSFLEHLEELRFRLIRALLGMGVAFLGCLFFAPAIWDVVHAPATAALKTIGAEPKLVMLSPMDGFSVLWVKLPMLVSVFVASPWILYQVWAFIAPGLYKKERRMALPFILATAGLFILGGLFAYFVAFRFGLAFLLGIGFDADVKPTVSIVDYTDLFVNVMLGVGLVFEMPVLIFFLSLLRIVTPQFLLSHSRYAILIIVIIAAVVTPTPDVFNLMLFAVPMVLLYFVGVFAAYILWLKREKLPYPWKLTFMILAGILGAIGLAVAVLVLRYGYKLVPYWPLILK